MVPYLEAVYSNAFVEDMPSENNHTELFSAIHEKHWKNVLHLLNSRPQEAKVWSSRLTADDEVAWKRLPIHEACIQNAPANVISALLTEFPESCAGIDLNNRLPIHHAAVHGADYEVIKLLINAAPASVNVVDAYGKTPAVCLMSFQLSSGGNAIEHNQKVQLLSNLFEGEPLRTFGPDSIILEYVQEQSTLSRHINNTKLMETVKAANWEEALEQVQKNPSEARKWTTYFDSYGEVAWERLPIHEACRNKAPLHVIETLLFAYKEGSKSTDQNNRLPLHHASVHGAHIAVIELLIKEYPESLEMEDSFGKTPLKCLKSPSQSELSQHYLTMEALSKSPSYYKNSKTQYSPNASTDIQMELENLKKKLLLEQKERMELQKKLEDFVNRSQILEEIIVKKTCENESLQQNLYSMQKEYAKLEMDVFSQGGSVISRDDRGEVDSLMCVSMLSFDGRSRPIDDVVLKDKSLKNLKAEMKERESMLEKALYRAKCPT